MSCLIRNAQASVTASTFGLGTIPWGTTLAGDALDRLYDAIRDAGGNVFDSAHVYAFSQANRYAHANGRAVSPTHA